MAEQDWMSEVRALVGREYGRIYAWDRVNAPMIRQWCEAMGIENPLYIDEAYALTTEFEGIVAPPAMLQAWCLEGMHQNNYPPGSTDENPYEVLKLLEGQGFASVVAVNSDLSFERYVRPGERLYYTTRLDAVSEEKTTALGTGYFVTLVMNFFSEAQSGSDEPVGQLMFRVFKFRPAQAAETKPSADDEKPSAPPRPHPGISDDTRFFWEGCEAGELRIQSCTACGELQHPPGPACSHCQSLEMSHTTVSGKGQLYSFVVMHYPEVPPFDYPNPIGLVELDEGVRLVAGLVDVSPERLEIGQPLEVVFNSFDGDLVLPQFRPVSA